MQLTLAQQTLSGSVISKTDHSPVAGAFVYAYGGQSMTGYAMSDRDGLFSIKIPEGKTADRITVTCLGFTSETVSIDGRTTAYTVVLPESHVSIRESKVTASVVEEKGDTVSFAAGAFANGTERVLGDLLEKMPGISVSQSGGIMYNGSYINKFYIEGMDLMGSGYGVVTKNLSPEKIARVEVYKRHQPIRSLVGVQQTDKSAVNIILKEDARNTWMVTGDLSVGAPSLPLFDAKALLTRFSKKTQDLYLLKGNNTGSDIIKELTQQQYMGRTGAFLVSEENMDSDFASRLNPRRSSLSLPQEYWYDNLSGIASFNHISKIDDYRQLRISLQGAAERYSESTQTTEKINFSEGDSMTINDSEKMTDRKYFASGKIGYENNSRKRYFRDELTFSGQLRDNSGVGIGDRKDYTQCYDLPSFKADNALDATFRTSERHAISVSSRTKFISNNHNADFITNQISAHQDLTQRSITTDNSISSSFVRNGVRFNVTGGLGVEYKNIDSKLYGVGDLDVTTDSSMDIFHAVPSLSLGSSFLLGETETSVNVPVSLNVLSGALLNKTMVYPVLSPSISMRRKFSQNLRANAYASYTESRSDVESLLPSAVMSTYRSISYSDSLSRRHGVRASASLNWEDNISMLYAGITGTAFLSRSNRMASNLYSEAFTLAGFSDAKSKTDSYGITGNVSKFFGSRTFVIEMTVGWNTTDQDLRLQDAVRSYISSQWNGSLSLRTSPADWISAEIKATYIHQVVKGSSLSTSNDVKVSGLLSLKPFKPMSIDTYADYLYEDVPGMNVSNTPLLKTIASWKFQRFSLVAECRNILGCKEFTREYVSAYQTITTTTKLMGRQFLVGIRMSL